MNIYKVFYDLGADRSIAVFVKADTVIEACHKVEAEVHGAEIRSLHKEDAELL